MVAVKRSSEERREGRRLSVHPSRGLRVQVDHQLLEVRGLASDPAGGARRGVEQQRDGAGALTQIAGTGRRISGAAAAVEGFEGLDGAGGLGRELDPDGELVVAQGDLAVVVRRGVQVPRPPLAAQRRCETERRCETARTDAETRQAEKWSVVTTCSTSICLPTSTQSLLAPPSTLIIGQRGPPVFSQPLA